MTGFLLDTNVVSDYTKPRRNRGVVEWMASISPQKLHISAMTIGEVRLGAEKLAKRAPERAANLRDWVAGLEEEYADRILPIDERVAVTWAILSAGRTRPIIDIQIAATAVVHELVLVTRNTKDFDDLGLTVLNPFT